MFSPPYPLSTPHLTLSESLRDEFDMDVTKTKMPQSAVHLKFCFLLQSYLL